MKPVHSGPTSRHPLAVLSIHTALGGCFRIIGEENDTLVGGTGHRKPNGLRYCDNGPDNRGLLPQICMGILLGGGTVIKAAPYHISADCNKEPARCLADAELDMSSNCRNIPGDPSSRCGRADRALAYPCIVIPGV